MIELSSKTADQLATFLAQNRVRYTTEEIAAARDWYASAYPSQATNVMVWSPNSVFRVVSSAYTGGWDAFVATCTDATPQHEYAGRIRGYAARAWVDKVGGGTVGRAYSGDFRVWVQATGQAELLIDGELLSVPEGLSITHGQAAKVAIEMAIMNADNA